MSPSTAHPLVWVAISAAVLLLLAYKGYLPISLGGVKKSVQTAVAPIMSHSTSGLSSHELGVLFVAAKRREAEEELASFLAKQAGDSMKAAFSAPFASPDPAGPSSETAGIPPAA